MSAYTSFFQRLHLCGCWYYGTAPDGSVYHRYMPQLQLSAHTTIMSTTSRTTLTQTFTNVSNSSPIDQVSYTFPLYDGVSVVGFKCKVGSRVIHGLVKEKEQARAEYKQAVDRGETAGLLEQQPEASDVFTTKIGNVPAGQTVIVEITYLGELKHDAGVDGVRFTIPTDIAPRYGTVANSGMDLPYDSVSVSGKGIEITVDVAVDDGAFIRGIQSPSHPIAVTLGRTSTMSDDSVDSHRASATLSLGSTVLEKDFVLLVLSKDQDIPRALLEHHPRFPNHRALMATLVPSFNLPSIRPEIVFVVDRSGSMGGKISTLISALKIFLKSLPVGAKFNICSFGSSHSFLWERSKSYDQTSLDQALHHVSSFDANFGGTEMYAPVVETVKRRYKDMQLEIMVLTDGQIWNQQQLFDFINQSVSEAPIRFFSLGIGASASHSLIEGIARAGNGFAQSVGETEKLDKKVVRMLKGAITPHVDDYTLEVQYENGDDGVEVVEKVTDSLRIMAVDDKNTKDVKKVKAKISLYNPAAKKDQEKNETNNKTGESRYSHLPTISAPKLLQAPHKIPPLYPFIRTATYLLMSPESSQRVPKSVILRATSPEGPLELEIPIEDIGTGQTIHQLAAKKAVTELEEGRGWIFEASDGQGEKLKDRFDGRWDELVEREAVRLGVKFQVGGKWCSFVAVEKNKSQLEAMDRAHADKMTDNTAEENEWESVDDFEGGIVSDVSSSNTPSDPNEGLDMAPHGQFLRMARNTSAQSSPIVSLGSKSQTNSWLGSTTEKKSHAARFSMSSGPPAAPMASPPPNLQLQPTGFAQFQPPVQQSQSLFSNAFGQAPLSRPASTSGGLFGTLASTSGRLFGSLAAAPKPSSVSYGATSPALGSSLTTQPLPKGFGGGAAPHPLPLADNYNAEPDYDRRRVQSSMLRRKSRSAKEELAQPQERVTEYTNDYDRMLAVFNLQTFDGSWQCTGELFKVLSLDEVQVKSEMAAAAYDDAVIATLLAVSFLETKFVSEKEIWELIVEKAKGWLESSGMSGKDIGTRVKNMGQKYFGGK